MGSNMRDDLPAASDPSLILTVATPAECRRVWTATHAMWGSALTLDDYLDREAYLTTVPLAMDGGITHWILTDGRLPPDERPLLSSCETLRKHAMAAAMPVEGGAGDAGGAGETAGAAEAVVTDGVAHGIASVFTEPQYRGKGYAGRMLRELGPRLRQWRTTTRPLDASSEPPSALCSVLYSDIGKEFYASKGWAAFPSTHLSFPPAAAVHASGAGFSVTPLGYHELTELCPVDLQLLRARLVRRATRRAAAVAAGGPRDSAGRGPSVALVPDLNTMMWHLMREDYMTKHIFGRTPAVRGALCTLDAPAGSSRPRRTMWAIWTRGYYGGLQTTVGNTLHILHFVIEDLDDDVPTDPREVPVSQQHVDGFAAILRLAQAEAAAWRCADVQMWNPTAAQRLLVERSRLPFKEVDREKDSIASLMWYGEGATESVDWVVNEKFGWY